VDESTHQPPDPGSLPVPGSLPQPPLPPSEVADPGGPEGRAPTGSPDPTPPAGYPHGAGHQDPTPPAGYPGAAPGYGPPGHGGLFYGTPGYAPPAPPHAATPHAGTPQASPAQGAPGYGAYPPPGYAPPGYVPPGWGPPGGGAGGSGYYPPGAGGPPPYGPPGASPWGPWPAPAPRGGWWQRAVHSLAAAWIAVAVLLLAVGGMAVALAVQTSSPGSATPATTPPGTSGGSGTTGPTLPGDTGNSGTGSTGSGSTGTSGNTGAGATAPGAGGPSAGTTSSIASAVDPGLVDIDTTLDQGGGAAGTGMVLTSSGLVLTNNHVIENATNITAQVDGAGRVYDATVLGYSVTDDVALLQLQGASGLTTIPTGSSTNLSVGQSVVAIGNALGRGGTPSAVGGAITALNRTITAGDPGVIQETLHGVIEMNAPIQSGDSGGPVVDLAGKVVGMNTAAAEGASGFGAETTTDDAYAIGISNALSIVDQIRAGKASTTVEIGPRALLGVEVGDGTGQGSSGSLGGSTGNTGSSSGTAGAYVDEVEAGSPAAQAGITSGDTIDSVDGTAVSSSSDLGDALQAFKPGDVVTVGWVDASGAQHSASVTLTSGPPA